ncbi:MAG TPA: methyltransferase domain-containing protein [Bryobacteraceae bacterium]|jgi:tRNA (mo5U34)-methyltransferase|nr:methyltransferase domain-containing protein [Bryobacteraceae bacterium]
MLGIQPDIQQITERAREFHARLKSLKARLAPRPFEWYPYDSLANVLHLNKLLTGPNRDLLKLIGDGPVADIGCSDGDLAFFLESLGCEVQAIDHPVANHNGMQGLKALRDALHSSVGIHTVDLDSQFMLPNDHYRLVFLLGVLYHLKNPLYILEMLARQCDYCVLSTRIANTLPGQSLNLRDAPVAYLLDEDELNDDDTNYWIFSEAGLRRLLKRTRWEICDWHVAGSGESDPNSLDRDQRVWCLISSRYYSLSNVQLLSGWHAAEAAGWRWTEQRFSARLNAGSARPARIELRFFVPQALIERYGPLTLHAAADGVPLSSQTYHESARFTYRATLDKAPADGGKVQLDFWLDHALPPSEADERELGIVVAALDRAS